MLIDFNEPYMCRAIIDLLLEIMEVGTVLEDDIMFGFSVSSLILETLN